MKRLGIWLILVGILTLLPVPPSPGSGTTSGPLCVFCGARGLSDILLNIALFIPFGWLAARRWGIKKALGAAVVITLGIEFAQSIIPGRFSTLGDVLANSAGGGLGAWLAKRPERALGPLAVVAAVMAVGPLWLFAPDPPPGFYYGQWTAHFGNMAHYEGRVLEATVGGRAAPSRRSVRSEEVRTTLRNGGPVSVRFEVGEPPLSLAPVFSIFDGAERRIFLLGIDGSDLVMSQWTRATSLRLDSPLHRWPNAMMGLEPGDTVHLELATNESQCLNLNTISRCDTAPSAADGWAALHSLGGRDRGRMTSVFRMIWMMSLGLLIALPPWSGVVQAVVISGLSLLTLWMPVHLPYLTASPIASAMIVVGGMVGLLLRRRVSRS